MNTDGVTFERGVYNRGRVLCLYAFLGKDIVASEYIALDGFAFLDVRFWERPFGICRRVQWAQRRLERAAFRRAARIGRVNATLKRPDGRSA